VKTESNLVEYSKEGYGSKGLLAAAAAAAADGDDDDRLVDFVRSPNLRYRRSVKLEPLSDLREAKMTALY
jgi:hypothetical protein